MRRFFVLFFLILATLSSCGGTSNGGRKVGVDASWYPLQMGGLDNNVTAFSTELLTDIGRSQKIPFVKVTVNWDDLMEGLQKDKYEAILSSMPPYIFNQKDFDFSELYLPLGPVLVVRPDSSIHSLNNLNGQEIAVIAGSGNDLLLEKSEGVLIRYYTSIPQALDDIVNETIDGAVIDILTAVAYCRDLYQNKIKVATPPLNENGLRLITKHNTATDLIKGFNAGLKKLKKNGSYDKLLAKWQLDEVCSPSK